MRELTDAEIGQALDELHRHLLCPICGAPKVHSRLRGYHCHVEAHNEQAREQTRQQVEKLINKVRHE